MIFLIYFAFSVNIKLYNYIYFIKDGYALKRKGLFIKHKALSVLLVAVLLLSGFGTSTFAEVLYTEPTDLSEGKLFTFDNQNILIGSSQLIDGSTVTVSDNSTLELQKERRVAGWGWSFKDDGTGNTVLRNQKSGSVSYSTAGSLRFNDNGEFCILKPAQAYYLSFKYKVVSAHVTFTSNGVTYPTENKVSVFSVGFGATVSNYPETGNRMSSIMTTLATPVNVTNERSTFKSKDEYGVETTKNVGEWYTEEIYFSTPDEMDYVPYLAFVVNFYNGTDLYIDDVYIKETPTVTLMLNGGSGIDVKQPAVVGKDIEIPTPYREGYRFAGWYNDLYCTEAFTDTVYTDENCNTTLYAKWEKELGTHTADFFDYETGSKEDGTHKNNVILNESNATDQFKIANIGDAYGTKALSIDGTGEVNALNRAYFPLGNSDGNITLKSNTTYSVLVETNKSLSEISSSYTLKLFTADSENANDTAVDVTAITINYSDSDRIYATFTTGEITEGKDALYIEICDKHVNVKTIVYNRIKLVQIDDDINYIRAYDRINNATYEFVGYVGDPVALPVLNNTANYAFGGWYTDESFATKHNGVHGNERVTYIYCLWENVPVDFENFVPALADSYHTVGDDIVIGRFDDSYGGRSMLKYSYKYAPNYFKGSHNAASLAVVYDKTTYKISFKYKLDTSLDDVQLKFFTAHRSNRWTYITNYDEATYTIYSKEAGDGWKEGTVYLTTDFVKAEHSDGLFVSFNPIVEGETVVCFDDFVVEIVKANEGIVAFLGKDGKAGLYERESVGATVAAPENEPDEYFSTFDGWYTDSEYTAPFTSASVTKGITYVYSKWIDNAEDFEGYVYENESVKADGNNTVLKNGEALLGEVEDNATYLVNYRFKTSTAGTKVYLKSANKADSNKNVTLYDDDGSEFAVSEELSDGAWHNVKRYISTSFAYDETDIGNMLYAVAEGDISIDDISISKIDVVYDNGSSVLTDENADALGSQAMRFFYSYKSENGATMTVDGEELTLVERGIVLKNTNTSEAVTLSKAENGEEGYFVKNKTYGFGSYWEFDSDKQEIVYSYYITGLYKSDIRNITARGYVKAKDTSGNVYTFYSREQSSCVKDVKAVAKEITDKDVHTFSGKNWNRFTIVNPKVMSYTYGMQIENLIEYAANKGVTLNRVTEKAEETPYEIVIGDTIRDTSALVSVEGENNYVIAVKGTKVIIKGGSDIATARAVSDFIEYLKFKDSLNCGADLYDGFELRGEYVASSDKYALTFSDDFDTFDTSVWGVYAGLGQGYKYESSVLGGTTTIRGYGNDPVLTKSGETKELVRVEDGNLVLATAYGTPTYQKDKDMNVQFFQSNISSFGKMIYQYGMLEIREKVAGVPACSSLWVNGDGTFNGEKRGCMTEFDLNENYGRTNHVESCIHHWANNHITGTQEHFRPDPADYTGSLTNIYKPDSSENSIYDDYHIYTFLWEEDKIVFAFDGVKYFEYDIPDWYRENAANNLILSCGMGTKGYGTVYDPANHSDYLESYIDYVKIYQVEDMGSKLYFK